MRLPRGVQIAGCVVISTLLCLTQQTLGADDVVLSTLQQEEVKPAASLHLGNDTRTWQDEGVFLESAVNETLERASASFASAVVNGTERPRVSILDPWDHDYSRKYYRFRNVQLYGNRLVFYKGNTATAERPPKSVSLDVPGLDKQFPVQVVRTAAGHKRNLSLANLSCNGWIRQPTILITGTHWPGNVYEFTSGFFPLWASASLEGLLQTDTYLNSTGPPSASQAGLNIIHVDIEPYKAKWAYWFDYITPNQWLLEHVDGQCFSDLTIVEDSIFNFMEINGTASYVNEQAALMKDVQRWMFRVESVHWRSRGVPPAVALNDAVPYLRRRVVIASRPAHNPFKGGFASRGLLNEGELADYIAANYDVNVTRIVFKGRMEKTMALMQQTDLLLGVHGAGLANAMWMRPGSHLIQIIPYGWIIKPAWNPYDDWLIRGKNFKQLCRAARMTYSQWVNPYPENAFFHKEDFERPEEFQEHPTPDLPLPADWNTSDIWLHQDTRVDLESFQPVLEEAMTHLNVPRIRRVQAQS